MSFNDAADRLREGAKDPGTLTYAEDLPQLLRFAAQVIEGWQEWQDKTEWVQAEASSGHIRGALGKHRADVMRDEIRRLRALVGEAP